MATVQTQVKYVLEWLNEFSEMQKSSFVSVLREVTANIWAGDTHQANGLSNGNENHDDRHLQATTNQVNGLSLDEVNGNENVAKPKPDSLYDIRVRFFREWVPLWPADIQRRVLYSFKDIDECFRIDDDQNVTDMNGNRDADGDEAHEIAIDVPAEAAAAAAVVQPDIEPIADQQLIEH